jgi:phage recombination protein Bet
MSTDLISFNPEQMALIKTQIAKDCTDSELQLFLAIAQRTGLDPFSRQIYAVKRGGKMTVQTSIDGYRLIADRSGKYAGADEAVFVHDDEGYIIKAIFTVYKLMGNVRYPFVGVAHWSEYVALKADGKPERMWEKMPYTMISKCAEAQALRRSFPADLSGIYTTEEMMQAGEESAIRVKNSAIESLPAPTKKMPPKAQEEEAYAFEDMITKPQLTKIGELLKACKFTPAEKAQWQAMMRDEHHAESAKDLTAAAAEVIISDLDAIVQSKEMANA